MKIERAEPKINKVEITEDEDIEKDERESIFIGKIGENMKNEYPNAYKGIVSALKNYQEEENVNIRIVPDEFGFFMASPGQDIETKKNVIDITMAVIKNINELGKAKNEFIKNFIEKGFEIYLGHEIEHQKKPSKSGAGLVMLRYSEEFLPEYSLRDSSHISLAESVESQTELQTFNKICKNKEDVIKNVAISSVFGTIGSKGFNEFQNTHRYKNKKIEDHKNVTYFQWLKPEIFKEVMAEEEILNKKIIKEYNDSRVKQHTEEMLKNRKETIFQKEKIDAPENFVSVFREITLDKAFEIDKENFLFQKKKEPKKEHHSLDKIHLDKIQKREILIDKFCPATLKEKGISRANNRYGYPFLERGHGIGWHGADRKFVKQEDVKLNLYYETDKKIQPEYLKRLKITDFEKYKKMVTDPEWRKMEYPGEVIELKIDPKKNYIGDMEDITRISDDIGKGSSLESAAEFNGKYYWDKLITVENFLKWYKIPEQDENEEDKELKNPDYADYYSGYCLKKGAPENLPSTIRDPEVLITENISKKFIKVVR